MRTNRKKLQKTEEKKQKYTGRNRTKRKKLANAQKQEEIVRIWREKNGRNLGKWEETGRNWKKQERNGKRQNELARNGNKH